MTGAGVVARSLLAVGLLQGCTSLPPLPPEPEAAFLNRLSRESAARANTSGECPPAYVRVCSGSLNPPTLLSCGCSSPEDLHTSFGGH